MALQENNYNTQQLYKVYNCTPPAHLKLYIQDIQILETHTFFSGSIPWHIMPDGSSYIIYTLIRRKDQYRSRLALVGPRTIYKEIDRKERLLSIILRFWPGGAFPWLPFPVAELADQAMRLEHLWGEHWGILKQEMTKLAIKNETEACVKLLIQALSHSLNSAVIGHPIVRISVQLMLENDGYMPIQSLATQLGISDRYLRKLMIKQVGLNPKRLARIIRITKAVAQVDHGWQFGWSALAHSSGYYDQAHMIDEFQALLGASPEAFVARMNREEV